MNKFCTPYILKLLLDVHDSTENGVWIALFLPNTLRTECIYANPASHEAELWIISIAFLSKFGRKKKIHSLFLNIWEGFVVALN